MRDRLIHRVDRVKVRLEGFAFDILDQSPTAVRIGQDCDRKVPLRHDLEKQNVPTQCSAMAKGSNGAYLTDVPRQTDIVVRALLMRFRTAHLLERFALEHALAACGGAVTHVKSSVGD